MMRPYLLLLFLLLALVTKLSLATNWIDTLGPTVLAVREQQLQESGRAEDALEKTANDLLSQFQNQGTTSLTRSHKYLRMLNDDERKTLEGIPEVISYLELCKQAAGKGDRKMWLQAFFILKLREVLMNNKSKNDRASLLPIIRNAFIATDNVANSLLWRKSKRFFDAYAMAYLAIIHKGEGSATFQGDLEKNELRHDLFYAAAEAATKIQESEKEIDDMEQLIRMRNEISKNLYANPEDDPIKKFWAKRFSFKYGTLKENPHPPGSFEHVSSSNLGAWLEVIFYLNGPSRKLSTVDEKHRDSALLGLAKEILDGKELRQRIAEEEQRKKLAEDELGQNRPRLPKRKSSFASYSNFPNVDYGPYANNPQFVGDYTAGASSYHASSFGDATGPSYYPYGIHEQGYHQQPGGHPGFSVGQESSSFRHNQPIQAATGGEQDRTQPSFGSWRASGFGSGDVVPHFGDQHEGYGAAGQPYLGSHPNLVQGNQQAGNDAADKAGWGKDINLGSGH